jgi:ammonia channel protein AmtB
MVATALVLLVTSRITDLRVSSDDEQTGLDMALHAERLGH